MVVTRGGFSHVVANAFAGLGFPAEAPTIYEFPIPMFNAGSDLTPIQENRDKVVYGLTQWQPKIKAKGIYTPDRVTVLGRDYEDALRNMNSLFIKNLWSDGLPLEPATKERVDWILTGTDLSRDMVIGNITPRGGIATVESIAVSLAMAGGRPEYLPVLIAGVQAITDPKFGFQAVNSTTCDVIPTLVVNGPIARQIRLSSGYGVMGPDPQHPAAQVIGRSLRLIQQDLGGAIPGVGTMAIYGGLRATNAVLAEDEEGLPKGWNSVAEDRGFRREQNVVTATPISGMANINIAINFGTKQQNDLVLGQLAKFMASPTGNVWNSVNKPLWTSPDHATGVALIPRGFAESLASRSGYSKLDVKTFLWNRSKLPWADALATGRYQQAVDVGLPEGQDMPITDNPNQIMFVVAGGDQSGHLYWMQIGHSNYTVTSREIRLPKNWATLLKHAEMNLGPASR